MNLDTSLGALSDSILSLKTRRIVKTAKTEKSQVLFDILSWILRPVLNLVVNLARSDAENTETLISHGRHLLDNLILELLSQWLLVLAGSNINAEIHNTLDSSLGEDHSLSILLLENDRHALDIRVEWVFRELLPSLLGSESLAVVGESLGENLKGNLSWVTGSDPALLFLIITDLGQVTETGRQQERLQWGGDFGDSSIWEFVFTLLLDRCSLASWMWLVGELEGEGGTGLITLFSLALILLFGIWSFGWGGLEQNVTGGWISSLAGLLDAVNANTWDPGSSGDHFPLGESSGLVRANVGNTSKSLQGVELSDDNLSLDHALHANGESNGQDGNKRFWDNGDTCI